MVSFVRVEGITCCLINLFNEHTLWSYIFILAQRTYFTVFTMFLPIHVSSFINNYVKLSRLQFGEGFGFFILEESFWLRFSLNQYMIYFEFRIWLKYAPIQKKFQFEQYFVSIFCYFSTLWTLSRSSIKCSKNMLS